jgi:hypothetical protein
MATNVYIDGFNLYYGCIKGTGLHWLNLDALARSLLRAHQIGRVKYFTARVDNRPGDPFQSQRQDAYLRALTSLPSVEVHFGQFRTNRKRVRLARPRPDGSWFDEAWVTEEKGTDVSLASHLLWDAFHRAASAALVISNDSDLEEPLRMAGELGMTVIVVNPHHHRGQPDHLFGAERRRLRRAHLERSQLPAQVLDSEGRTVVRPAKWDP